MDLIAPGVRLIDLDFLGRPGTIATAALETPAGVVLVDPGPPTCLDSLRRALAGEGLSLGDLHALLVTHIHLDHAASAGTLVREQPRLRVYVHELGAPHLIDPSKLLSSATRLYGAEMARLWGEIVPVPASSVIALAGGEVLDLGGRKVDVAYTPGHARHHVCYFDSVSGVAFMGDTGGVRVGTSRFVLPPTPPPEIDVEAWRTSVERVRQWAPSRVFVTHFGASSDVDFHLGDLVERLDRYSRLVAALVRASGDDGSGREAYEQALWGDLRDLVGEDLARAYSEIVSFEHCWQGLARYWRARKADSGA